MILPVTYAKLKSVGGTSYLPALGEGKRPGRMSGGICPGGNVRFPRWTRQTLAKAVAELMHAQTLPL